MVSEGAVLYCIPMEFLQKDPLEWEDDTVFKLDWKLLYKKLKVVNDTAKRGVKLMEDYNKILSRSEEEKQYILQIVSEKIPRQYEINIGSGFVNLDFCQIQFILRE